jgi:hypothetical protein
VRGLLSQPSGFEGFAPIGKEVLSDDLAVAQGHDLRRLLRDRYPAGATFRPVVSHHQDTITPVAGLLDLHPVVRIESAEPIREPIDGCLLSRDGLGSGKTARPTMKDERHVFRKRANRFSEVGAWKYPTAISTFSCDIAYSESPRVSRASA